MGNPVGLSFELVLEFADLTPLDADHAYKWFTLAGYDERPLGIILWHRALDGQACGGAIWTVALPGRDPARVWRVLDHDALTLDPDVWCAGEHGCGGTHGWVHNGLWLPRHDPDDPVIP